MKKNVTFFADFGSKNRPYTGGYYFAECLLGILRKLDINLTIFSAVIPKIDKDTALIKGDNIIEIKLPIGGFGNPFVGLKWAFQLRKKLKKMPKQDLYIFDQPMTLVNILPKAPAVAMFHGSDFVKLKDLSISHPRDFFYSIFWRKMFLNKINKKFLTKEIGIPLFNSNDTLNRLSADFTLDPRPLEQYVTHLPVDTDKFKRDNNERNKIREYYKIADDEILIVALSNFDLIKRADRLSSIVLKILKSSQTDKVKFLLIGGGRISKPIDDLIENPDFLKNIIRIKEVSHNDVYKYYSAADIALSASERESFGYFIAEGMSTELPFVAYRGGAIEEVIQNNTTGFVVDSEDEFLESLQKLLNDNSLRLKMGEVGRERVIKMFSMEIFKERLLNILKNEFQIVL